MRPQERDEFAKRRKLEAIEAELALHRRMAHVTVPLVVFLNAVLLALLAYHLFIQD